MKNLTSVFCALALFSGSAALANGVHKEHYKPHKKHHHKHVEPAPAPAPMPAPTPEPTRFFNNGFYAGGQIGYSFMHGVMRNFLHTTTGATDNVFSKKSASSNKFIGEILLGYRHYLPSSSDVMMGLELAANWDGHKLSKTFNERLRNAASNIFYSVRLRKEFSFVPAVTIGYTFCPKWMVFAKLGVAITRFKERINFNNVTSGSKSFTKAGVAPSLGLEYAYTKHVSFLGTVSYEAYPALNKKFTGIQVGQPNSFLHTKVKRPYLISVKVGALYRF